MYIWHSCILFIIYKWILCFTDKFPFTPSIIWVVGWVA